jgi:hypothetical protein
MHINLFHARLMFIIFTWSSERVRSGSGITWKILAGSGINHSESKVFGLFVSVLDVFFSRLDGSYVAWKFFKKKIKLIQIFYQSI